MTDTLSWPIARAGEVLDAWRRAQPDGRSRLRLLPLERAVEVEHPVGTLGTLEPAAAARGGTSPLPEVVEELALAELTPVTAAALLAALERAPFVAVELSPTSRGFAVAVRASAATAHEATAVEIHLEQLARTLAPWRAPAASVAT